MQYEVNDAVLCHMCTRAVKERKMSGTAEPAFVSWAMLIQ